MSAAELLRPRAQRIVQWAKRRSGHAGRSGRTVKQLERCLSLNQLQRFEMTLNRHGWSLRDFSSIFEFGCGDGRLLEHFFELLPQASVSGCDVLAKAIAACQSRYPRGRFLRNHVMPPLPVEDATYDFIYSYSVFTHLSEPAHKVWLRELARMLQPGGVMLHTVHSYAYLRRTAFFSPERLDKYRFQASVDRFVASGQDYYYTVEDPANPWYGHTIMNREYVLATWPHESGLTLVDYVEGAVEAYPEGCQDLVVLHKPRAA